MASYSNNGNAGGGNNYNNNFNSNNRFNNRKRKNVEDSNYNDDFKRSRTGGDSYIEDELEACIFRLGEVESSNQFQQQQQTVEANIESSVGYIVGEIMNKRSQVISLLLECASKLPEKLSIYTTLIGLLNLRNAPFVEEVIDSFATHIRENLKNGNFFIVHRMIRFISDLVNVRVLTTKSVLDIYRGFVEVINDPESPQVRNDFYVYCVLSSLPWNGKLLYENHGPEFDEIVESIKGYVGKRQKDYLPLLKVWSNDDPHPQEEYLDCLWAQIKKLEDNDWKESQIIRPYTHFATNLLNGTPADFPNIVPTEHHSSSIYPLPRVIFRMFDYTDVPEEYILPGAHSIERYLVEEQLHSTINTYYLDRKLCANKLIRLNVTNKIPLNYMIVEIIFSQLLQLPKSAQIEVFYGSLLLELCRLQPNYMPQVLAQATELIFERLDCMKTACIERFAAWFAYHLSNFEFKWSWEDWKECVQSDLESPKNKFLRETLIRSMRLSYHQKVMDFLPKSMEALLPAVTKPTYRYESEEAANLEGTLVANRLLELFKERAISEDVFQALRDIPDPPNEMDAEGSCNPLKIEVFASTLLFFGNKSFSHAFAALAKYHMIFKMLVDSEASQIVVLNALHGVWKNHQQMMVVMVDKMLKTQIVDCASVAKWIFSESIQNDLTSFYVWEILNSTINRMSQQVHKLQHEYNQLTEKFKKSGLEPDMLASEITEEEIEMKLQTLNALKEQQQKLFHIIIERLIEIVNDHFKNGEVTTEEGERPARSVHWIKWVGERFESVLLNHNEEILPIFDELKAKLITPETNRFSTKLFRMVSAFKK